MRVLRQIIIGLIAIAIGAVIGTSLAYFTHNETEVPVDCCPSTDTRVIYRHI